MSIIKVYLYFFKKYTEHSYSELNIYNVYEVFGNISKHIMFNQNQGAFIVFSTINF